VSGGGGRSSNTVLLSDVPDRVLAVYAHPDHPEVACGGTLAHWAAQGAEVRLVVVNDGDKGSADRAVDPAGLAERRAAEVRAAAEVLGPLNFPAAGEAHQLGARWLSGWRGSSGGTSGLRPVPATSAQPSWVLRRWHGLGQRRSRFASSVTRSSVQGTR
jgi:GlcNAc-PI de-N-acetylase